MFLDRLRMIKVVNKQYKDMPGHPNAETQEGSEPEYILCSFVKLKKGALTSNRSVQLTMC